MTYAHKAEVRRISIEIHERVANYLNNRKRKEITGIEESSNVTISINARTDVGPEHMIFRCTDDIGSEVKIPPLVGSKSR